MSDDLQSMTQVPVLPPDVVELCEQIGAYLPSDQVAEVVAAFHVGAQAHSGQTRRSGEAYIHHPVAVAKVLADMRMDVETLVAAILHDTIEDTHLTKQAIAEQFGEQVSELVDGVTKLDKLHFSSRQEAAAESFRKMLMAMARDLRVILIKLADRLHNMRTLGAMTDESSRRIALETLEIYAPIAQRLGMNAVKSELQDRGFAALYPKRYRVLSERLRQLQGNRLEAMDRIQSALSMRLTDFGIEHRILGRIKSPHSIFRKMRADRKSFSEVMDVYGVRVIVIDVMQCYQALGAVHNVYKPVEGRFKDFIAIPKANGYQSLHTALFGPYGMPVEIQIRTEEMDTVAERGVAAHWTYKSGSERSNNATARARDWLQTLLDTQQQTGSSMEFMDNVRVELFPDEVYLFTPKGQILALPRHATPLDFAYAVHTDVGDHAVAARVDRKLLPLRTRLVSGQTVEIITANGASPKASWLEFVVTSKARTAIRHYLKRLQHEDAVQLGHRMLDNALDALGTTLDAIAPEDLDRYLADTRLRRLEELLAEIAFGNRMPGSVAAQLVQRELSEALASGQLDQEAIRISGSERGVLSFSNCCHPIPGDQIMGFLSAGKGVVVHQLSCKNVAELRKQPERWVVMDWADRVEGDYRTALKLEVDNRPGVLAQVASAIAECDSNIENVEYKERDVDSATLLFTIEVSDRRHLARVMRRVRRCEVVQTLSRVGG